MDKPLVVICGPTSSGKTSLSIKLAKEFGGELVSADSRQVYRFMDVGTGKIPHQLLEGSGKREGELPSIEGIPVHLYDLVNPNVSLTVVDYASQAWKVLEDLWQKGKIPFLVGGTGFYLDVVLGRAQTAPVPPNPKLRQELEGKSLTELNTILKGKDEKRWQSIDQCNPRRLVRAIEIAQAGRAPSVPIVPSLDLAKVLQIGLTAPREVLYRRADTWAGEILADGSLIKEVKDLIARGYRDCSPLQGIIYKPALDFVEGKIDGIAFADQVYHGLHAYIRRQQTYFKRYGEISWYDITEENFDKGVLRQVRSYLDE